jgi:hypothetical protein
MLQILTGIFIILHGLVHLWYLVLSFQWVKFQPDMGWTGQSWLFSKIFQETSVRSFAGVLFALGALAFIISGIGFLADANWLNPVLLASAVFSSLVLILFWDGSTDLLVQKGLVGLLINLGLIALFAVKK